MSSPLAVSSPPAPPGGESEGTETPALLRPAPGLRPAGLPEGIVECRPAPPGREAGGPAASFVDVAAEAGVQHRHQKGEFDPKLANIMPWIASIGAAAAAADYDGDGRMDLYVSNSRRGTPNALYRNDGAEGRIHFSEGARQAGVADLNDETGVTMDVDFGDIDNDGDPDLYVVKWGRNQLFRNDGGRFTDITGPSGTGDKGNGNCGLFFDYDNDGFLDILVCNYFPPVDLSHLETTRIMHDSFEHARNGGPNVLYHNQHDGTFREVAHSLNLDDTGWSLDAGISDINNDGLVDVYLANDFGQDRLYLNNGNGTFTDITARAIGRETFKGMNVDFGDFDGDGFTDIYVANITTEEYLKEGNFLWLNNGDGSFVNVASTTGTADGGWGWCARFLDYDNDGDLDILAVNGFVSAGKESYWESLATTAVNPAFDPADAAQWPPMGGLSLSGYEPSRLFRNNGDGSFTDVALKEGLTDRYDGRGIVLADFDGDGDLDVFVVNQDQPACLYRNEIGNTNNWLTVRLRGTRSSRDAIGARLQLTAGTLRATREVNGVNGFSSQSDLAVHFGLGQAGRVDRLTVFWPSGVVQDFRDLEVNRHLTIEERGEPMPAAERLALYFARPRSSPGGSLAAGAGPASPEAGSALLSLEREVRRKPRNALLAGRYRAKARELGLHDREIEFFRGLIRERGGRQVEPAIRLQLALALIDKIPAMKGDILAQGSLAKESLGELAAVLEAPGGSESFGASYVAGMNHLYWPETLKHAPDALKRFERCREILAQRRAAGGPGRPAGGGAGGSAPAPEAGEAVAELPLLIAIGDAEVKNGDLFRAREEWKRALALYPGTKELEERLSRGDREITALVKEVRGLEKPIDTSLPVLALENGLAAAESAFERRPDDRQTLNGYRLEAGELDALERAGGFLAGLAARNPSLAEPRLALALLEIDRLNCLQEGSPGTAAPAGGGSASGRAALAHLREFRERKPGDWLGPYLSGLLWLYLPSLEEPKGGALSDLAGAERLAARADGRPRLPQPALALGDGLARAGRLAEARQVWQKLAEAFPRLEAPRGRLAAGEDALPALLAASYDPRAGIPTDLEPLADTELELDALEPALEKGCARADADRYRALARRSEDRERAIRLFRRMVSERPRSAAARVQLALALLDRTRDPRLGSVERGLLSSEALLALEPVARLEPQAWGVRYLIGVIHLDWFTKLKHVSFAIEAFDRCLQMGGGRYRPLAFQAAGDALVKDKRFPLARRRWQEGQKEFPDDRGLEERMGQTSLMVEGYVERIRSWEAAQDTDLLSAVAGDLPELPEDAAGPGAAGTSGASGTVPASPGPGRRP